MPVRLLLVRHGRVDFGATEFLETPRGRQWDPPLDDKGRDQADKLAARLAATARPDAVFVSPFRRALQTLEPFTALTGIRGEAVDDFGEVFVGEWEGVPFEDLIAEHGDLVRERVDAGAALHTLAPGAESGDELRARVVPAVESRLPRTEKDATVLIVTHGGVINAYLGHLMGLPQDMFFLPDNSSINRVDVDGDAHGIRFLNDVAHLWYPTLWSGGTVESDRPAGPGSPDEGSDLEEDRP
jgi:probable phosphoglycerate mutase